MNIGFWKKHYDEIVLIATSIQKLYVLSKLYGSHFTVHEKKYVKNGNARLMITKMNHEMKAFSLLFCSINKKYALRIQRYF